MSYSLCLFDLDGTLTNPKEGITKSVQYALARFGIEVENLDTLVDFIGPPLRESFQKFYGFSPEQAEQAIAAYREYYTRQGIFENELYEGCDRLLGTLARRGYAWLWPPRNRRFLLRKSPYIIISGNTLILSPAAS